MKVSSNKRKYQYDFANAGEDDTELNVDGQEINLTNQSLKNTVVKKIKKQHLHMSDIITGILDKDLSSRKYKKVIFSDQKQVIKTVEQSKRNLKLEAIKNHMKRKKKNIGRKIPNHKQEFQYERRLKIVAVEGITQLFNAMSTIQKDTLDEIVKIAITEQLKKPIKKHRDNNRGKGRPRNSGFLEARRF